jgi:hypothetical protein
MKTSLSDAVFDYRALRLFVGLVALGLPEVAAFISSTPLSSISASYYTEARDIFIGSLFVIGALLWAYNGRKTTGEIRWDKIIGKVGSLAAFCAAIFPTSCTGCGVTLTSTIHYVAAVILFSTVAYFCWAFRNSATASLTQDKKAGRRVVIYSVCIIAIVGSMLGAGAAQLMVSVAARETLSITYYAELVAMLAFGVAWTVAGKVLPPLVDEEERLKLSLK